MTAAPKTVYRGIFLFVLFLTVICYAVCRYAPISRICDCPAAQGDKYSPIRLLECANRIIEMGEDKGYRFLQREAKIAKNTIEFEKIAFLCQVVYEPIEVQSIRRPTLGGMELPSDVLASETWPCLPLVFSEGVPFLMIRGYYYGGPSWMMEEYLEFYKKEGRFRDRPYPIPTGEQVEKALLVLFNSERWQNSDWESLGPSFENEIKEMLRSQASRVQ